MMTSHRVTPPLILLIALGVLTACDKPHAPLVDSMEQGGALASAQPAVVEVKEVEGEPSFHYSPYVLKVNDNNTIFDTISFKDVGVNGISTEERELLYEIIAESLSTELTADHQLAMTSAVVYDEKNLDPSNHLSCGASQLYVDFWRSEKRWGYSLWSGCGDEDNFAWKEIKYRPDPRGDLGMEITPLTRDIITTLRQANERKCYQKTC